MAQADDLGTRTYAAISQRSINTEPTSWTAALGWFVKAAQGNVSGAARLAGVPRRSMRDWLSGVSKPKAGRAAAVIESARLSERRARLKPGRESRLRNGAPGSIVVKATYNYDGTEREVAIGNYMDDYAVDELIDAYLSGADEAGLREEFADQITLDPTGFYARTFALGPNDRHGWSVERVTL